MPSRSDRIADFLLKLQRELREAKQERLRIQSRSTRCTVDYERIVGAGSGHSDIVLDSVIALEQIDLRICSLMLRRSSAYRFLEHALEDQDFASSLVSDAMLYRYEDEMKPAQIMKEMDISRPYCFHLLQKGNNAVNQYGSMHPDQVMFIKS